MIKTLTTDDIIRGERKLEDFRHADRPDWAEIINESWNDLMTHVREMNLDYRKLAKNLTLSTTYAEDFANRNLLVVESTAVTSGEFGVVVLGANDTTGTGTKVAIVSVNSIGITKTAITDFYRYYKLSATNNHTCYLVESVYEYLHKLIARWYAYRDISDNPQDDYGLIATSYEERFFAALSTANFKYDSDDSGEIEDGEYNQDEVIFRP